LILALLGFLLLVLETLRLAGILRSGNALPLAFTVTLPVFWLAFFLWKAGPSERPAVTIAALIIIIIIGKIKPKESRSSS
jgi:fucose 4-O-acetylase-like acetyltransferase